MKIKVVSYVLNELYNNGVVRSKHKLDDRDFLQMARAAKGSVARKFYFEEKQNGSAAQFVADMVKEKEYPTKTDVRKRIFVDFDYENDKIMRLPEGMGIIRITAIYEDGPIDYNNNFTKGIAGSEGLYCTKEYLEDTGLKIYMASSDQIRLFCAKDTKLVEMLCVVDNDDTEIPEDIVWEILNYILVVILRVFQIPIDRTDDSSPTVQFINSKLATAQPL